MSSKIPETDYETGFYLEPPDEYQGADPKQDVLQSLALFSLFDAEQIVKNPKWGDSQTISLLKMSKTYRIETLEKLCLTLLGMEIVDNKWHLKLDRDAKRYSLLKDPFIQDHCFGLSVNAFSAKALDTLFSSSSSKQIKSLKLIDCEQLTSDTLKGVDQIYPHIQALTLQGKTVDDAYVKGWFKRYQKSLTYIDVSSSNVTDELGELLANYCPNITTLKLEGCQALTYKFIKPLGKNCRQLSVLNIGNCPKITEKIIKKLTRHDQKYDFQLTALDVSGLVLTDQLLNSLGITQGKTLTILNLSQCQKITQNGVAALSKSCPDLKIEVSSKPLTKELVLKNDKVKVSDIPIAFGKEMWATYLGDIGDEPPLPPDIKVILSAPCPFFSGKKVEETHLLVLIPKTVNGKPLTLRTLGELVKKPLKGTSTQYRYFNSGEYKDSPTDSSHWVLMTRDVIPGSRNKSYVEQQKVLKGYIEKAQLPYEVPPILDATACIFMEFLRSGTRLCGDSPLTYTRCQEGLSSKDYQLVVGGFASAGLDVNYYIFDSDNYGIVALRKFF